ncbi:Protein T26E4.3, partial [Aphelenchoides avenae]
NNGVPRISLLFVGDDKNFTKEIDLNGMNFSSVTYPQQMSRGADLCFVASHCDTILLSSSGSTFGFWMAYLSTKATVYCNAQITKNEDGLRPPTGTWRENLIPTEWIRLRAKNGSAVEEHNDS